APAAHPPPPAPPLNTPGRGRPGAGGRWLLPPGGELAPRRGGKEEPRGRPPGAQRAPTPPRAAAGTRDAPPRPHAAPPDPRRWAGCGVARVGVGGIAAWESTLSALTFLGDVTMSLGRLFTGRARFRWRDFAVVVQECGAQALPIVTLINFLVGMIIAFVGAVQ